MKHRLAVAYDAAGFSPIEVATAVGEMCALVWVVDTSRDMGPMAPMLQRTGDVVDIANLTQDSAISRVADCRPAGIVAFSDTQLSTAAAIASGLSLRYNSPSVTRLFLDKYAQRVALRDAGIAVPRVAVVATRAERASVLDSVKSIVFPAVMKPRHGSGSRDTYRVESAEALTRLSASLDADESGRGEYIVEEFIPDSGILSDAGFADYVSVESVVVDGKPRHLAITGKFPLAEPYRETGNFIPCLLSREHIDEVRTLADDAVAALGVECGCLHTEIKVTPVGPRVIEMNARVGGGGIDSLFAMSYGESLLRISVLSALGLEVADDMELRSDAIAYQVFVQPPMSARRIERIGGLDEVSGLPGVEQVFVNRSVGDATNWRDGSQGYVASVRGWAPDHGALRLTRERIADRLDCAYT